MKTQKMWLLAVVAAVALLAAGLGPAYGQALPGVTPPAPDPDFTVILFPDTQVEVECYPAIWEAMTQWCVNNKTVNNIQAVIGLGDVTNTYADAEFTEAVAGWNNIKNSGIPYVPLIGNHDYAQTMISTRDTTKWNANFGISYFTGQSWFGGALNNYTENYYVKLDIGNSKYLILCLEVFPRPATVDWADDILKANLDRQVIVATHSYLNNDGSRSLPTDKYSTVTYLGNGTGTLGYSGSQLWDNLIKQYSNILLVVCGHYICSPTSAYSKGRGVNGNLVHQLFCDHQCDANGGNGYLMILKFRPALKKIEVTTYSPTLNAYDATGTYTLTYPSESAASIVRAISLLLFD